MANRSGAVDVFRGIGISLVVLGHVKGLPSLLHNAIYSFHMPAFFLLSGFLFKPPKSDLDTFGFLRRRFQRLVLPAWFIGLVCGCVFLVMLALGKIELNEFLYRLYGSAVGFTRAEGNFMSTPLWFLFCLFCIEFIGVVFFKLLGSAHACAMLALGVLGLVFLQGTAFLPFALNVAIIACAYFGAGALAKQFNALNFESNSRFELFVAVFAFLAWVATVHISGGETDMSAARVGGTVSILGSLLGVFALYFTSKMVSKSKSLQWLGSRTIPILGFNYLVGAGVSKALSLVHLDHWMLSFLIQLVMLAVIAKVCEFSFIGKVLFSQASSRPA